MDKVNPDKITPFMKQCFVTAAVGINIIGFGCGLGYPAVLLPQLQKEDSPVTVTNESASWLVAVLSLSVLFGNLITPPIMDRLGRKTTHYALTVIFMISWIITMVATSVKTLLIGRLLHGIAAGLLTTLRSILIGEYTSPKNRGAFLTIVSLTQAFGVFFVHLVGSLMSWQITALISLFFHFISLIMIIYTPESPSWLVSRGRYDESRGVFRWLRGTEEDHELEDMIEAKLAFDKTAIKEYKKQNWFVNLSKIIRRKEFYKPITIMILCNNIMQFSGAPTMAAYSTVIISMLMGPKANPNFWMVFIDSLRLVLNIVAIYVIHRVKRRMMMSTTGVLSVASHFAIAIYVYCRIKGWSYDAIWLPALLINLQFLAVAVGTVPMPQVIGGEIFPLEYRSTGNTISIALSGGVLFLALKTFPISIENIGLHGTYAIYGGIILTNLIMMLILLPETKGKTLQEIEDELRGGPLRLEELEAKQSLRRRRRRLSERRASSPSIILT